MLNVLNKSRSRSKLLRSETETQQELPNFVVVSESNKEFDGYKKHLPEQGIFTRQENVYNDT